MRGYKEKECGICGKVFKPYTPCEKYCCEECAREGQRMRQRIWQREHQEERRKQKREWKRKQRRAELAEDEVLYKPEEPRKIKPDNIIAIGYAERQIARSLELAGKVRTEL